MKRVTPLLALCLCVLLVGRDSLALSVELKSPDIFFPKGYDAKKNAAILAVLNDKDLRFESGIISYWEPHFWSTIVYGGDTKALEKLLDGLTKIDGIHVRLTFAKDSSSETGSALTPGTFWVKYSHTEPDTIQVRVNLKSKDIDISQLTVNLLARE